MTITDFVDSIKNSQRNELFKSSYDIDCFCSTCKSTRRMAMSIYQYSHKDSAYYIHELIPSLWICICKQCEINHFLLLYKSSIGISYIFTSEALDGIATPNTPVAVSYYLDQAYKSRSMGANSACVAMYRAALEQVLYQQGFTRKMLGNKLNDLDNAIQKGIAPQWANSIEPELLKYIKELGDGSIHPNDGDTEKQRALDNEIIETIDTVFSAFLYEIYEKPQQKLALAAILSRASSAFKL